MSEAPQPRGVHNPRVIDMITGDSEAGEVVLVMLEDRHWGEVEDHLQQLQEKFNAYLSYVQGQYLAQEYPRVVAELAKEIHHWCSLHPASGTRAELMPPPGWRAPKDWATYPIPLQELQDQAATGMPPKHALIVLDWQYGENGRLIYNCEPYRMLGGGLCR